MIKRVKRRVEIDVVGVVVVKAKHYRWRSKIFRTFSAQIQVAISETWVEDSKRRPICVTDSHPTFIALNNNCRPFRNRTMEMKKGFFSEMGAGILCSTRSM
jgi:hypothetical protein